MKKILNQAFAFMLIVTLIASFLFVGLVFLVLLISLITESINEGDYFSAVIYCFAILGVYSTVGWILTAE